MTLLIDLKKIIKEHCDDVCCVNGTLLARDLRALALRHETEQEPVAEPVIGLVAAFDNGEEVWLSSHTGGAHKDGSFAELSLTFKPGDGSPSYVRHYRDINLTVDQPAPVKGEHDDFILVLAQFANAFPTDIFPPLSKLGRETLDYELIDCASAAMARHLGPTLSKAADIIQRLQLELEAKNRATFPMNKTREKHRRRTLRVINSKR